jgi:integrase
MATFRAVILRGNRQTRTDGLTNVKIRLYHNGTIQYISTDLYVSEANFKNGQLSGDNSAFVNGRIADYMKMYSDRYLALGDQSDDMTAGQVRDKILTRDKSDRIDFLAFARGYLQQMDTDGRRGTVRGIRGLIYNLELYTDALNFQQINAAWLDGFARWMYSRGVGNAVINYMVYLRSIFNRGRDHYNDEDRGIIRIPNYPFKKYRMPKKAVNTGENALTVDQLKTLLNFAAVYPRQQLAVDVCRIMICLMGLNAVDVYNLKAIKKGRIIYARSKTGHRFSVRVEPELLDCLKRRKGAEYLFNFRQQYGNDADFCKAVNKGLASICRAIHIKAIQEDKKTDWPAMITTNWIRHTWATIARNDCGISKDDVALCLGHKDRDNAVTDIYIRYDHTIQDKTNRAVLDKIFK